MDLTCINDIPGGRWMPCRWSQRVCKKAVSVSRCWSVGLLCFMVVS